MEHNLAVMVRAGRNALKKFVYALAISTLGMLMISYIAGFRVSAQAPDFDAYKGAAIPDGSIDGTIGTEWNDAGHYTNIPIDPSGTAEIWTKHDGTNLYIALRFTADSNNPWLTFQLGADTCMDNSADLATFGNDNLNADGFSDAYFDTGSSAAADTAPNGIGWMVVGVGNVVTLELKKPLNSGDTLGKDIAWTEGSTNNLAIAWDSNGNGSSGGTASHRSAGVTGRKIFIDPIAIPEFPGWMLILVLFIVMVPVMFLAKKMIPKLPATRKL